MAKIVVAGSLIYDFTITADKLPKKGETIAGSRFTMCTGGKGANQAVQAARLGQEVWMIGRVGDDFIGRNIVENMKNDGVNTDFIIADKETPTGAACIHVDENGDNAIMISPGANMRVTIGDIMAAKDIIEKADILICQLEITTEATERAIDIAREAGVRVILNPAPAAKIDNSLFGKSDYVTPNETETEFFTGMVFDYDNIEKSASDMAVELKKLGGKNVIITLGKYGAFISDKDGARIKSGFTVKATDATAAGDAFNAAFAVSIANGKSHDEAIIYANGAGALAASKAGSQSSLPQKRELEEFITAGI